MILFLNIFIIVMALFVIDYFIKQFKNRKSLVKGLFNISILLLAAGVLYLAVDNLTSLIFN